MVFAVEIMILSGTVRWIRFSLALALVVVLVGPADADTRCPKNTRLLVDKAKPKRYPTSNMVIVSDDKTVSCVKPDGTRHGPFYEKRRGVVTTGSYKNGQKHGVWREDWQ